MFTSPERKASSMEGMGIQYIPGHVEEFVDYVLDRYIPESGDIIDLGGGGLRFAIPVAMRGKKIAVVDGCAESLDIPLIVERVNKNAKVSVDLELAQNNIAVIHQELFSFLEACTQMYNLVTAFRVVHFFTPNQMEKFFRLVSKVLASGGVLAVSSITPMSAAKKEQEYNEIFQVTLPVQGGEPALHRKFNGSERAIAIQSQQNLASEMHFVDDQFIALMAKCHGFTVRGANLPSTEVVRGYILQKI